MRGISNAGSMTADTVAALAGKQNNITVETLAVGNGYTVFKYGNIVFVTISYLPANTTSITGLPPALTNGRAILDGTLTTNVAKIAISYGSTTANINWIVTDQTAFGCLIYLIS